MDKYIYHQGNLLLYCLKKEPNIFLSLFIDELFYAGFLCPIKCLKLLKKIFI